MHYNTLAILYTCYINKECTQKQVCIEWYIAKQTVNTICKNLISQGLLTKVKNDKNHREMLISLTDKGNKLAKPIVEELLQIESNIVSHLGDEGAEHFLSIYSEFCDIMEKSFSKTK